MSVELFVNVNYEIKRKPGYTFIYVIPKDNRYFINFYTSFTTSYNYYPTQARTLQNIVNDEVLENMLKKYVEYKPIPHNCISVIYYENGRIKTKYIIDNILCIRNKSYNLQLINDISYINYCLINIGFKKTDIERNYEYCFNSKYSGHHFWTVQIKIRKLKIYFNVRQCYLGKYQGRYYRWPNTFRINCIEKYTILNISDLNDLLLAKLNLKLIENFDIKIALKS